MPVRKTLSVFLCLLLVLCTACSRTGGTGSAPSVSAGEQGSYYTDSASAASADGDGVSSQADGGYVNVRPDNNTAHTDTPAGQSPAQISPEAITTNKQKSLWCYSHITNEQKYIYSVMLSAARNMTRGWISLGECEKDYLADIAVAYRAFTYDFPELFWVPYTYAVTSGFSSAARREICFAFEISEGTLNKSYLVSASQRENMQKYLDREVQNILSVVNASADTDFEKELALHDILVDEVEYYSDANDDMIYTVYGALVNKLAVCEGYARAMSYLCRLLDIPCMLVAGTAKGQGHMWNIVSIENEWYHVDATWDDVAEYPVHTYFNISDSEIIKDHIIDCDLSERTAKQIENGATGYNFGIPSCTSSKCGYFEKTDYYIDLNNLNSAARKIAQICGGESHIELRFTSAEQRERFAGNANAYIGALEKNVIPLVTSFKFRFLVYSIINDQVYLAW